MAHAFSSELARLIWQTRYRAAGEADMDATWRRVSRALASVEPADPQRWATRFHALLRDFRFLPGGRILAGAGLDHEVTLFNCFVMGPVADDMAGIFDALKQGALTMQQGGGVGYDFSTLRPAGLRGARVGGVASGPVSFMRIWDAMCATLLSTAARRGAMMGTLRCDHPDIEAFVDAKREVGELRNFNLSVLVSDDFLEAVEADKSWPLVFPVDRIAPADLARWRGRLERRWSDTEGPTPCAVIRTLGARELWDRIMRANFDTAGPGVLFIDRINAENNLGYREWISATNPCGEIPLPPYGACNLGSLNLTRFVRAPFGRHARLDLEELANAADLATRLLDDAIDLSRFPLEVQAAEARGSRRIGLGVTGLADALIMLGLHYGSPEARDLAATAMRTLCHGAYRSSVALAVEKGPFPFFEADAYLASPFVQRLPEDIRADIGRSGIHNSHLTAIAPAGTISLLAGNVSSGVEPVFGFTARRRVRTTEGGEVVFEVTDPAALAWRRRFGTRPLPAQFVDAHHLEPGDHLAMEAALQPCVDNAISKTINVPEAIAFGDFERLYLEAYRLGLKGCTTYRPNPITGAVLTGPGDPSASQEAGQCCNLDREGD
jgi:ribonucleoside-diphosphate reductase alpha chain